MLWQLQRGNEQQETIGYDTLAMSFLLTMPSRLQENSLPH